MDQLKKAVLRTIKYGKKYGVEYGVRDIERRLISKRIYSEKEIAVKLSEEKRLKVDSKKRNVLINKVNKAIKLGKILEREFPDILMVGITGSVAAEYPKDNEDIDLMIISKENSLWINRLGVKIWAKIMRIPQRSYGDKEQKNDFCFNLWLEEDSLKLPNKRQNLKNAMDLILMKPVVNKNQIYERFIKENGWAKKYVATGYNRIVSNFRFQISNEKLKDFGIKRLINQIVFWLQYLYMRKKLTEETVGLRRAFFHPKSRK